MKIIVFITFVAVITLASVSSSFSDTIYLKDKSQVKGIVVEEYNDRIVISTEYGESEMMKEEIKKIIYD